MTSKFIMKKLLHLEYLILHEEYFEILLKSISACMVFKLSFSRPIWNVY